MKKKEKMRKSGHFSRQLKLYLFNSLNYPILASDLERLASRLFCLWDGAVPAFYSQGFPYSICVSLENIAVHGKPGDYLLAKGMIVTIDLGVNYLGYFSDTAFTRIVGNTSLVDSMKNEKLFFLRRNNLLLAAERALKRSARLLKQGIEVGEITSLIYSEITSSGYFSSPFYGGHGIGRRLHMPPFIPNVPNKLSSLKKNDGKIILKTGNYICIEPIVFERPPKLKISSDG